MADQKEKSKEKRNRRQEKFDALLTQIAELNEKMNLLITLQSQPNPSVVVGEVVEPKEVEVVELPKVEYPIPIEYRQLVSDILNASFGIELAPRGDIPAFEFIINVPKKYSNASAEHWKTYKQDSRPIVIEYSKGMNGVREWCERVFNNFNTDIRSMIVSDRLNAQ